MIGEWTVAYDQQPGQALENRGARPMTTERIEFLRQFATAQIVMYEVEATKRGYNQSYHGWFYWNFKMESKTYEEWDFLSGIEYGWMPILQRGVSAQDQFGTCSMIAEATHNKHGVVDMFPPPSWYPNDDSVDDAAGTPLIIGDDDAYDPVASVGITYEPDNIGFIIAIVSTGSIIIGLAWLLHRKYYSSSSYKDTSDGSQGILSTEARPRLGYSSLQMVEPALFDRRGDSRRGNVELEIRKPQLVDEETKGV